MGELATPQFDPKNSQKKLAKLAHKYGTGGKVDKVHKVMGEFKRKELHSGSKSGPKVKTRKQAIAIALSEKRRQLAGKYAKGGSTGWWKQLKGEVQQLTPRSPLQQAAANNGPR